MPNSGDYSSRRVLVFGTFDPLHKGHRYFLQSARALGGYLMVVAARDAGIREYKNRQPQQPQQARLLAIADQAIADEVILGDENPRSYSLLQQLDFDILALGYDQGPEDKAIRLILDNAGKKDAAIARLAAYQPQRYKSTYFRK